MCIKDIISIRFYSSQSFSVVQTRFLFSTRNTREGTVGRTGSSLSPLTPQLLHSAFKKKRKLVEDTIWKMTCSLQTCPNTAGSHLTSCSGKFAKQATRKPRSRQAGAQGQLTLYQTPRYKHFHSLQIKEDPVIGLTVSHTMSRWIPSAISHSLGSSLATAVICSTKKKELLGVRFKA